MGSNLDNKHLLNKISWPCDMPLATKLNLLAIAEPKAHISSGKLSFVKHYNRGIYYAFEGLATFSLISSDMKPLVGSVIGCNDWFGGMVTHDFPDITLYTAEVEPLSLLFFPKQKVEELGENDPNIFKFLHGIGQINIPRQFQAVIMSYCPIVTRLAYCLIEILAHKVQINGAIPMLKITQQQLADLTGLSRPRISEAFKQLQDEQLISLSRGAISIINVDKLYEKLSGISFDFYDPYSTLMNSHN